MESFQVQIPGNHCWGCGTQNPQGLGIKSFWDEPGHTAICRFEPRPEHMAGPTGVLNGGIIATLIDCHSICSAIALGYLAEDRPVGSDPVVWYVTASLEVTYLKPTPLGLPVDLLATITGSEGRKTMITCSLSADGAERVRAQVLAVRVPSRWLLEGP